MIDLHMHSVFSDGSLHPTDLVEAGVALKLRAMALTDHDTIRGVAPFIEAVKQQPPGMLGFTGVEISAEVPSGTMHILGYGIDPGHAELAANLELIRDGRAWRNERILEALAGLRMPLNWNEVARHAGDDVVGRPHFAQAMIERGYVRNKQEAFDRFLAKGQEAYVDRFRLTPEQSIALIRAAGGIPVLAHPVTLGLDDAALRLRLNELAAQGLGGIEVYYSEHTPPQTRRYIKLAHELGLMCTGGSDFHGTANPNLRIGSGFGSLRVPDALAEDLAQAVGPAGCMQSGGYANPA